MAKIEVKQCDKCDVTDDVKTYIVREDRAEWAVDLCPDHAIPLVELRVVSHPPPGKRGPYKRFHITTLPPQPGRNRA